MKSQNILIIDIGNSYIKIGLYEKNNDKSKKIVLIKTNKEMLLQKAKKHLKAFSSCNVSCSILGSVVPDLKKVFEEAIISVFNIKPYLINKDTKFSFKLDDCVRNEIGEDLLALSEYCSQINKNIIGFSFGTATASVFLFNNKLEGVFILPGISFGLNHLVNKASLLEEIEVKTDSNLLYGNNTKQALEAGINNLRRGVVISSYYGTQKQYKINDLKCLISGGEASSIDEVEFEYIVDKEAILLGFKKIYLQNN